jgi:hypothetical protein
MARGGIYRDLYEMQFSDDLAAQNEERIVSTKQ